MPINSEGLRGNESAQPLVDDSFKGFAGLESHSSAQVLADIEDGIGYRTSVVDSSGIYQHPINGENK